VRLSLWVFTPHARIAISRRGLGEEIVEETLLHPE